MRPDRFDGLSRAVGGEMSRRRIIKLLAAGSVAGLVGVSTLPASAGAVPGCGVQTLGLWVNAFIPGDIPGYTRVLDAGPFAGFPVIPAPFLEDLIGCFSTDNRSFSDLLGNGCFAHPSSRIAAMAQIDLVNQTLSSEHICSSGTLRFDCSSGEVTCNSVAEINGPGFHSFVVVGESEMALQLRTWASDPCVNAPKIFVPDVDIDLTFNVRLDPSGSVRVWVSGAVDIFPAYEIYAMADGGSPVLLFQYFDPSTTAFDLGLSNLAAPVSGFGLISNDTGCELGTHCCGSQNGGGCCPDSAHCCGSQNGGGCCPNGTDCCPPGPNGEHVCCAAGWSCCPRPSEQGNNGCCPPAQPLCCPPETSAAGCCPFEAPNCCLFPGCCPLGWFCCNHPVFGPGCCRPRSGLSETEALNAGEFEDFAPATRQVIRSDGGTVGRSRMPRIRLRKATTKAGR
jgi:hypothetical protein